MKSDSVIVVIDYRSQPGKQVEARRELASLIATVVATEPACSGIELLHDVDDPTHFLLYERWSSREAYIGPHMRTSHITAFIAKALGLFAGPPTITFFSPVE